MADTNKATAETSADLHYDLSKINIDQPVHELIDQGKKIRDSVPFEKLGTFIPVKRNVVQGISHV